MSELLLPERTDVVNALAACAPASAADLGEIAKAYPQSPLVWALLSDELWAVGATLPAYAYARVGYYRGLDDLNDAGWDGTSAVPFSHEPNRGFLLAAYALRRAAATFGETSEVERLTVVLDNADPEAIAGIESILRPVPTVPMTEAIIIRGAD